MRVTWFRCSWCCGLGVIPNLEPGVSQAGRTDEPGGQGGGRPQAVDSRLMAGRPPLHQPRSEYAVSTTIPTADDDASPIGFEADSLCTRNAGPDPENSILPVCRAPEVERKRASSPQHVPHVVRRQ